MSIIGLFRFGGYRSATDHVQTQWLAPSSIHFLQIQEHDRRVGRLKATVATSVDKNNVFENGNISNTQNGGYQPKGEINKGDTTIAKVPFRLPKKLQVTEKDGSFIALDNNSLKQMRQLERLGHCTEVEVEIVPLSKVPPNVVQEMGLGDNKNQHQHHQQQRQQRKCEDLQTFENTKKHCKVQCRAELAQRQLSAKTETVKSSTVKATSEHRHLCHSQHSHCFRGTNDHSNEITVIKHITESVCDESKSMITKGTESAPTSTCTSLTSISRSTTGANTATTCSTTTSFSLNGFNTYLSDQQLRTARMSNTMTVMAPCLRQPITTSTPTSDLAMRNFKWHFCCAERQHSSGKTCYSRADTNNTHKSVSGDHHHQQKCQSGKRFL